MVEILFGILLLLGLIWGSYFDLKNREIPDYLSYSMITGCLGISLIYSLVNGFEFLLFSVLGGIIVFCLGYIFYYFKQVGGGDVKIFTAIGIACSNFYLGRISMLIVFGVILLVIGGVYSLIWGIVLLFRNRKQGFIELKKLLVERRFTRRIIIIISLILIIIGFFTEWKMRLLVLMLVVLIYLIFYLDMLVKVIEKLHFVKKIKVSDLTEGDWLAKDVIVNNQKLISRKEPEIEKKHIELLKRHNVHEIWIKIGIPFVPAILISFVIAIVIYGILG